ncbi:MAG TPA: VOC family protein [Opitutaceae bacterium]|nr:VOC family protein [Opitutaceae bacterium]
MQFEHFALNVSDAPAHARWYVEHVGFRVVRQLTEVPFTHFLADDTGRVIVELYSNPKASVPKYADAHPLCFHVALVASDARAIQAKLVSAGASFFSEEDLPDGGRLIMLRDPWGVPLQLCQRAKPLGA